jgi:poly-gamma-glutamate synthesis protein (capsule biosynthesis protein)
MTRVLDTARRRPLRQGVPVDLGPFRVEAFTDLENYRSEASSKLTESQVKEAVAKAQPPVVAFMHWGTQFDAHPTPRQRLIARWLKEAGVGFVVGMHPHVADDALELTAHTSPPVAYSLGNFLFDESSKIASGAVVELRVFDQGTFFARIVPIPTYYDLIRRSRRPGNPE